MAHPMSSPGSFESPEPGDVPISVKDKEQEQDFGLSLKDLATTLSAHGGGTLSADLALDLVLNEIVEQARLATNATAAAIALAREDEIVCRATTGTNAPDLGVRLDAQSGLSGACVQKKTWQRCDDTELDPRVNAEVCRYLKVRSILVFPVLQEEKLLGVVEVFSARPNAFSDREIQTLEALSRSIVENIDRAANVLNSPAVATDSASSNPPLELEFAESEPTPADEPAPVLVPTPETPEPEVRGRDYGTSVLTMSVIVLALTLGWMVGHVGQPGKQATAARAVASPVPQTAVTAQSQNAVSGPGVPAAVPPGGKAEADAAPLASKKNSIDPIPAGGLVVYEKGKVVFRATPQPSGQSDTKTAADAPGESATTKGNDVPEKPAALVSPEVASQYLTLRVEPEYPQQAREQHIQGPVILEALVDKGGAVEDLKTISGDPVLASAASEAVRQWRFKPLVRNGQPQEFQTRITVSFRLP